jgi:signal transduction histidine kinase/DNA-binding response OmpR family regulator
MSKFAKQFNAPFTRSIYISKNIIKTFTFLLLFFAIVLCSLPVFTQSTVSINGINSLKIINNKQSHSYQLSIKTASLVSLMSQVSTASERVLILENLKNEKSAKRIQELKDQLTKVVGDERLEMKLNERLGRESKWVENLNDAYQFYTRTLYLAEKLQENRIIAIACFEIANSIRLGNVIDRPYDSHFLRAIEIFETLKDPLSKSYLLYAKLLREKEENIKLEYAKKAIELLSLNLNRSDTLMMESLARHLNVVGLYQEDEKGIETFKEGLSIAKESGNYMLQAYILNNMGYHFRLKQEYDKAIPYHLEALDISIFAGIKGLAANSFNNLSFCYRNKGMYKEALEFYQCFFFLESEVNTNNFYQNLAELQITHNVNSVELKNDVLLTEQKFQGRQKLILSVTSFLLLLIVGLIFWSRNKITKTNKKLQALDKVKSRFFANISHELRTPITLINGPIEAVIAGEYGEINAAVTNQLMVVKNNGKNLLNLVNEILDLTKLEAGKLELVENPVQIYSFLNELFAAYQSEIESRKINFHLNYSFEKELSIAIDQLKFAKIINNLLSNAFKFTADNGKITVCIKEENEKMVISVKDYGLGIHPDDVQHVFERFYQSAQPDIKASGGTGIGLALSLELAKLQKGSISVVSELGVGCEFIFSFPLKKVILGTAEIFVEEVNVQKIKSNLSKSIAKYADIFEIEKPVLLLTEDHKEMRGFIVSIVKPFFRILEAANGLEALEILENNTIDIIISDVMMPKMDGFELLENIKGDKRFKNISMIMLTARALEEDKLFALTLGVDDYLTKPFSREELLVRTRNILDNKIARKQAMGKLSLDVDNIDTMDETFIKSLKILIEKNIDSDLLSVLFLAIEMSLSERQLLRKVKLLTGYTPVQLIKEIRLIKAKSFLENQQINSVAEAAYKVGFTKVQYFSNQYIKRFGKKPSDSFSK